MLPDERSKTMLFMLVSKLTVYTLLPLMVPAFILVSISCANVVPMYIWVSSKNTRFSTVSPPTRSIQ